MENQIFDCLAKSGVLNALNLLDAWLQRQPDNSHNYETALQLLNRFPKQPEVIAFQQKIHKQLNTNMLNYIPLKKQLEKLLLEDAFETVFELLNKHLPDEQTTLIIRQGAYNRLQRQVEQRRVSITSEHYKIEIAELTYTLDILTKRLPDDLMIQIN